MPPSPRAASESSTPVEASPVGWNCTNSGSFTGMPARKHAATPSPVMFVAFVVRVQ